MGRRSCTEEGCAWFSDAGGNSRSLANVGSGSCAARAPPPYFGHDLEKPCTAKRAEGRRRHVGDDSLKSDSGDEPRSHHRRRPGRRWAAGFHTTSSKHTTRATLGLRTFVKRGVVGVARCVPAIGRRRRDILAYMDACIQTYIQMYTHTCIHSYPCTHSYRDRCRAVKMRRIKGVMSSVRSVGVLCSRVGGTVCAAQGHASQTSHHVSVHMHIPPTHRRRNLRGYCAGSG